MMAGTDDDLDTIAGGRHRLLEQGPVAYSHLTIRRAYVVWLRCGQRNNLRSVCDYYHRLEAMEATMTREQRVASLHNELQLFDNPPPRSDLLREIHPDLYPPNYLDPDFIDELEAIRNENSVFKQESFQKYRSGISSKALSEFNKLIQHYCNTHYISPHQFLLEFRKHARENHLKDTLGNIANYIQQRALEAELLLVANFPKSFDFLDEDTGYHHAVEPAKVIAPDPTEVQSMKLKKLLGVEDEASDTKSVVEDKSRDSSCSEFFKMFAEHNKPERLNSSLNFEDFARVLQLNQNKTGSINCLAERPPSHSVSFEKNNSANGMRVEVYDNARKI